MARDKLTNPNKVTQFDLVLNSDAINSGFMTVRVCGKIAILSGFVNLKVQGIGLTIGSIPSQYSYCCPAVYTWLSEAGFSQDNSGEYNIAPDGTFKGNTLAMGYDVKLSGAWIISG